MITKGIKGIFIAITVLFLVQCKKSDAVTDTNVVVEPPYLPATAFI